jgi:HK97 family phage major capsid protein
MWLKFTKECPAAGRKAGDRWEVQDDTIARAYITAGYAVEDKAAETDLLGEARKAISEGLAAMQAAQAEALKEIARSIGQGFSTAAKATRFSPGLGGGIEASESEDEKFLRSGGFRSIGHYARSISKAGPVPGRVRDDSELGKYLTVCDRVNVARAVSTPDGMYETSEPDGGALVPPDFTTQIWERVYAQENLLARTQSYTVSGNTMVIPANAETSRADGSRWGGVLGYWEGEAQQLIGTRPKFRNIQERLKKLTVMTFVTNELLTDSATALEQYLGRVAPQEITFKILNGLINGTGAGMPLGILNDPAFVSVAKDTGQAHQSVSYTNIMNIYNTMWAPCRSRAIWVYNQEIEPQLWQMALPVGTGGVPVFLPPGVAGGQFTGGATSHPFGAQGTNTAEAAPYAMLYGRPALCLEQCPGLGTTGDIMLIDWSQYITIVKGSIQTAMSIHLKFDYDETVFRWIFRMDGQGAWYAPLTPFNTNLSKTYTFAVGLATR